MLIAILLVCAAGSFAFAEASAWRTFTSKHGRFSVELPGQPKASTKTVDSFHGQMTEYSFEVKTADGGYFLVHYVDLPARLTQHPTSYAEAFLEGAAAREIEEAGAKLLNKKVIALNGIPGLEVDVALGDVLCRERFYCASPRMYKLLAAGPRPDSDVVGRFFNSFRIAK